MSRPSPAVLGDAFPLQSARLGAVEVKGKGLWKKTYFSKADG